MQFWQIAQNQGSFCEHSTCTITEHSTFRRTLVGTYKYLILLAPYNIPSR